jgi:hypothetical protein
MEWNNEFVAPQLGQERWTRFMRHRSVTWFLQSSELSFTSVGWVTYGSQGEIYAQQKSLGSYRVKYCSWKTVSAFRCLSTFWETVSRFLNGSTSLGTLSLTRASHRDELLCIISERYLITREVWTQISISQCKLFSRLAGQTLIISNCGHNEPICRANTQLVSLMLKPRYQVFLWQYLCHVTGINVWT